MSYRTGTILRNGFTDSAVVLKDGSIYELKRDGRSFNRSNSDERRTFVDVASWRASLSNVDEITKDNVFARVPKEPLTSRVFQYSSDMPHYEIALDLLRQFKSRTDCHVETAKEKQQGLLKAKIALLKLELDPPEIDHTVFASTTQVENVKSYYLNWMRACSIHIAELSKLPNSTVYKPIIAHYNPKVFIKSGNEMVPLAVHEPSGHIVLNGTGYKTFQEATQSSEQPEFWALWNKKLTKLDVFIARNAVPEPCTMLPFEYRGVTYMRVGRERDNFWSSGDLWQNNNGVKGAYVGCLQQDGGINESAESAVWERARGAQWQ